jgi:hypothetical protein
MIVWSLAYLHFFFRFKLAARIFLLSRATQN